MPSKYIRNFRKPGAGPGNKCSLGYLTPRLAPKLHPTTQDICWAAGVYEGEGSFCKVTDSNSAIVSVSQKDLWLLQRLKDLFGGSITENHKCSRWNIGGARGHGFIMTIFQFLSPRRQNQIRTVLEAIKWLPAASPL